MEATSMLDEICGEIHNYFLMPDGIYHGEYSILNGSMDPLDMLTQGQYFRIIGSKFNDGVYQHPAEDLIDEDFTGTIWMMAPPTAFLALVKEIESWCLSDAAKPTAYQSESFGGYSYTRMTGENGAPLTWVTVFNARLNRWRKVRAV